MIIYLGCRSPGTSCNLPGNVGRAALKCFPIWSCTRWGLPCLSCHHESGELLPRHFNLTCACRAGHRRCIFCGTFLRLPGVRVTNHRALWCSDFPPRLNRSDHAPTPILLYYPESAQQSGRMKIFSHHGLRIFSSMALLASSSALAFCALGTWPICQWSNRPSRSRTC